MAKHPKYVICPNPNCNRHVRLTRKERKKPLWKLLCRACLTVLGRRDIITVA